MVLSLPWVSKEDISYYADKFEKKGFAAPLSASRMTSVSGSSGKQASLSKHSEQISTT
jgi:hypothetical protein